MFQAIWVIPVMVVTLYIFFSIKILSEYERGVVFRLGRVLALPRGPGIALVRLGWIVVLFFLVALSTCLRAQETISTPLSNLVLQDAAGRDDAVQVPGSEAVQPKSSASIAGAVRDAHGAAVPGIRMTLVGQNNAVDRVVTADSKGAFTFAELLPGIYQVKITAVGGLEPYVSAVVVLGAGERRELPIVGTRIPTTSTSVNVVATLNEIAQAQVQEQEKQRVLGFLPNYYSSYIWDAAPMTPKLKFKLSLRSTTDPVTFLVAAGLAGVEQRHNTFPGYGQGSEGYAKRFGTAYADTMVSKMVSRAILPTVLHQDPRYFYRGSGSIRSRIFYALAAAVICRGDNGRLQPNYSQVLGNFAASGISNLYRAPGDRTASLTFRNGLIMTGSGAVENLLREFFSRKLTSNVPEFANGKP
jgi:Carboxypeptidase regulatory-like domain